jgi:hypothetical protein
MRHHGLQFLAIVLTVLAATLVGTGPSSAKPTSAGAVAPESAASVDDTPVAQPIAGNERASARLACGNTFDPPAPQGAAMTHYYKNCNGFSITVTTGYQDLTGQITVFGGVILTVPNLGEVSWSYGATQPNVNYHTIIVK